MSSYRQTLEFFLKGLEVETERVLDIGGGANPVYERVRAWNVKEYKVMDNYAEDARTPVNYEYDINFEISHEEKKQIGRYDIVFCLEVFEYIYDPIIAVGNLISFLKDNGHAYISFPTLYPLHNPDGMDYLRYTKDGVVKLLEDCNVTIEDCIQRMPTPEGLELLRQFYISEGFHARKHTSDIYSLGYIVKIRK